MGNPTNVEAHERLMQRIAVEQDDVLATLQLVRGDDALESHLFEQLVDLLVEGMFVELRQQFVDGEISRADYLTELASLATLCRGAGLLPLPGRDA